MQQIMQLAQGLRQDLEIFPTFAMAARMLERAVNDIQRGTVEEAGRLIQEEGANPLRGSK